MSDQSIDYTAAAEVTGRYRVVVMVTLPRTATSDHASDATEALDSVVEQVETQLAAKVRKIAEPTPAPKVGGFTLPTGFPVQSSLKLRTCPDCAKVRDPVKFPL